jgi:putative inorganic carbon (HCO3(-)) transporter
MNAFWQTLTLSTLSLQQWRTSSYLHHLLAPLRQWRKSSVMLRWGNLIGAVLVSLVFAIAPFVSDSKDSLGLLLIACAGFWFLLTLSDEVSEGQKSSLSTPIHGLMLLYWGISAVSTVLSPVKRAAFTGLSKLTLYMILFALMARVLRSPRIRSLVITVYLLAALAVSVYGLQQWFYGADALATWVDPDSSLAGTTRVYSYLGNPNLLAGYLVPAVVFSAVAVFAWQGWIRKLLAGTMTGMNAACLVFSFSRGGWLGLVVAGSVLLLLLTHWYSVALPKFWRRWGIPIVLGGAAAVLILAVVSVAPLRDRVGSMFAGRDDKSNNFRINVWMAVIDMIKARPLLGIGPGNVAFNQVYPLFQRSRYSALSAYSIALEVLVETGLIGLLCFVWLLIVTFNAGWTQVQKLRALRSQEGFWLLGALAAMVGMLAHGLVDTVWFRPQVNTLWWLMIAIVASYYNPLPTASPELADAPASLEPNWQDLR